MFIRLLEGAKNDTHSDLDGVLYWIEEFEAGRCTIVTSTLTRVEVLDAKLPSAEQQKFRGLLKRSDLSVIGVTGHVADIAHEIRSYYSAHADKLGPLGTPDSIHLATALVDPRCDAFLTMDGRAPQRKGKDRPLLHLSNPIAGRFSMNITLPKRPVPQGVVVATPQLPLGLP